MTPLEMTSKDPDVTFGSYNSTYWSVVESNLAIMCASLPTWKYVLGKLFPCMFPSQEERRSYGFIPARRRTHGNHRGNWLGRLASRNHTYNLSGGLFGNSNVSQASSQAPIIASVPAARQRSPGFRAVPYDSTVSAGEPSTGHETPELDFDIPNGDAGRLHGQDATKRDAKPAPYPTTDDDDEDFMAVLKDPEVRGYDTMADSQ